MNVLRQHSEEYLAIRRALGYKLVGEGQLLTSYVTFAEEAGTPTVTTELAVAWTRNATRASSAYLARRMRVVRPSPATCRPSRKRPRSHQSICSLAGTTDRRLTCTPTPTSPS